MICDPRMCPEMGYTAVGRRLEMGQYRMIQFCKLKGFRNQSLLHRQIGSYLRENILDCVKWSKKATGMTTIDNTNQTDVVAETE